MKDGTSKSPGNICDTSASCEVRDLLDRIADKWSLLVIELLARSTHRFSQLHREIDGVSKRMLTITLRQLERDGLVRRTVYAVVPPRVDYELTPLGETVITSIQPLITWTREHRDEVAAARADYDHRATTSPEPALQLPALTARAGRPVR